MIEQTHKPALNPKCAALHLCVSMRLLHFTSPPMTLCIVGHLSTLLWTAGPDSASIMFSSSISICAPLFLSLVYVLTLRMNCSVVLSTVHLFCVVFQLSLYIFIYSFLLPCRAYRSGFNACFGKLTFSFKGILMLKMFPNQRFLG